MKKFKKHMLTKEKKQKVYNFTAFFEPAREGGYVVTVPALPGCFTQGETFEEAEAMIKDAIKGYLRAILDLKEEVPVESEGTVISKIPVNVCLS